MSKLPPGSPISHKIVVGSVAVAAGTWLFWQFAKDFQFVKFEPRSAEEIKKRQEENIPMSIKQLDTRTLEYTPEAKERLKRAIKEHNDKVKSE